MQGKQIKVTFEPHGQTVFVLPGTKLIEAAARAGLTVHTPCGAAGTCGKCRVRLTAGQCEPTDAEARTIDEDELAQGWRLACQARVCGETVVSVPDSSLFVDGHQILTETDDRHEAEVLPAFRKVYVELTPPTLESDEPDLLRLENKIGPFKIDLGLLRRLPTTLREGDFKGTAVLTDHHLIAFEAGDTTDKCFGLAFDVGTTTLVGALLDLRTGEELAVASDINPQVSYGDDVLSRIKKSGDGQAAAGELREAVLGAIIEIIDRTCAQANVAKEHVYEVVFAGNTTMEHLLCGLDVTQLGQVPFVPAHARGLMLPAAELGIVINENARAYVFPVIGGFVGGDTVSGMLATKLADIDGPCLMVDIGTNGEIVLASDGEILAASTAAGPAFEGARISCGMRAAVGAIEKVVFNDDVQCSVIGNTEPVGLCGSGLIDLVAGLLQCGLVTSVGRMLKPDELPDSVSGAIAKRVRLDDADQPEFVLAGSGKKAITLNQRDIRELQLGAGAIRAGVQILLRESGLSAGDLSQVLIAGGFGSFIRRSNAQRIGLLPEEIDRPRIRYVGNASLNGAKWALLSTQARRRGEDLARKTRHVELSMDTNFQNEFADAMIFPEG